MKPTHWPLSKTKKPEELSPEERARADRIDLRCLSLCTGMLERVDSVCDVLKSERRCNQAELRNTET